MISIFQHFILNFKYSQDTTKDNNFEWVVMGVEMNRLTDIKIKKISQKGRYPDGLGLFLNIGKTQNKN